MEASPFEVTLYDKSLRKLRTIGAPTSLTPTIRHNQQSSTALVIAATPKNSSRIADLLEPGTRAVVTHRGEFLTSGAITSPTVQGPARASVVTVQITDDFAVPGRMLGSPQPGTSVASGSSASFTQEYDTRTGPAETVLKGLINANKGRLSVPGVPPLFVAPDLGRGRTITSLQSRFSRLDDKLLSLVDAAGIGITVRQLPDGNGGQRLVLDVYEQRTYPRTISEASGAVQDYTFKQDVPKATRVMVGGKGEGTARVFTPVVDAALEARLGYAVEAFLDATDTDTEAQRVARGQAFLADNRETNGISVTLLDTPNLRFTPSLSPSAPGLRVGDLMTLRLGTTLDPDTGAEVGVGIDVKDVLRAVTLAFSASNGVSVTPQVGDITDSTDPADAAIRNLARQVSTLRTR